MWYLAGEEDGGRSRHIPVNVSPFQIGRRSDLMLCLPCPTVSKLHAELRSVGDDLLVRDLQSTNGTYVNGHRVIDEYALSDGDLLQFGNLVFEVGNESMHVDRETCPFDVATRARKIREFDTLMAGRDVLAFFQPVVDLGLRQHVGFEVLGRSRFFGLHSPREMFEAASLQRSEAELSRILRLEGTRASVNLPGPAQIFFNTHPAEIDQPGLLDSLREIRELQPELSIVLEIHESMVSCPNRMSALRAGLRELGIDLAYDDFGAGQSRLLELCVVPPDVVKFDMSLVQGISIAAARKQRMLQTLVRMVRDVGIVALAEGIECEEDALACHQIGFELAQGFHFGRPALAMDCLQPAAMRALQVAGFRGTPGGSDERHLN